jgi:hypothetical protein
MVDRSAAEGAEAEESSPAAVGVLADDMMPSGVSELAEQRRPLPEKPAGAAARYRRHFLAGLP